MLLRPYLYATRPYIPSQSLPYRSPILHRVSRNAQFSTSSPRNKATHYEILNVPTNATQSELKKRFYILSKETHPDLHRNDPEAGERFAQISESYSVLSNPEKRQKYDREVLHRSNHHRNTNGPGGGSGTFAGSRAPTGLSKRRGVFRGPPPSYFSHGKTQASSASDDYQPGTFNAGAFTERGRVDPAFDAGSVYRTQTHEDTRRQTRRQAAMEQAIKDFEDEGDFWARFFIVTTIVVLGVTVAGLVATRHGSTKGGLVRGDGSRRDSPKKENSKE